MRLVVNAGGLNPAASPDGSASWRERLGLPVRVAHVEGDDLTSRAGELGAWANRWPPTPTSARSGSRECLRAGADVVVTGRVTDASLVVGPAAAHFGWSHGDLDALAGAVVAGHVIECGAQATGGNYAFFTEHRRPAPPGLPARRGQRRRLVA